MMWLVVASSGVSGPRPATNAQFVVSHTPVSEQLPLMDPHKPEERVDQTVPTACDVLEDLVEVILFRY